MVNLKKLLILKIAAIFLSFLICQGDFTVFAQQEDFKAHFSRAKQDYLEKDYEKTINRLERLLAYAKDEDKEFLDQVYLLLAASYEHQGKIPEAKKNYTLCKQLFDKPEISGIDFSSLIEYQRIIPGKKIEDKKPEKREQVIEKTGKKKKKKKKPVLLIVLGVVAVGALAAMLMKGKKESGPNRYTLTVTKGEGVNGTPDSGAAAYNEGSTVNYNYSLQSGYHNLDVTLDGSNAASSGTITMNRNHTLTATATKESDINIEWITIPAGEFKMGDNFNEGDSCERPGHTVYLDSYRISKYEVTFDQYDQFCDDTGRSKPSDMGWGRGNRPVINVSWNDAKAYCDWLSQKTGQNIHLPTEAQWEKAARGTDQRRYPWGNSSPNCNLANYGGCGNQTKPVGSHPSGISPYGIHDMAGNVWEWCSDWYSSTYYSVSPPNNPTGPSSGSRRVRRGGHWGSNANNLRSAVRHSSYPSYSRDYIGFRLSQ